MKRTPGIVCAVVAIYAIGFAIAWTAATSLANRKTRAVLLESRETFARISEDMVDTVLWYASLQVVDEIGAKPRAVPSADLQRLAERLRLDELDIADSNGVTVASSLPSEVGYVYASNPITKEFLALLRPDSKITSYGQPYRPSTSPPYSLCKYYAVAFPDRSGFIELGFALDRLTQTYGRVNPDEYRMWTIGRYGRFEALDRNGDGLTDVESSYPGGLPAEGVMGWETTAQDGEVFTYTFAYAGLLFRAVVPAREFHEQRNLLLTVGGISLAVILAFLTYFVVRLSASTEKLAALHREAEARTAADLSLARVIQLSSLTRTELFRQPQLDSTFDAVTYPARQVGGDFYDVFERSDGRIVFLVADVSGKGVPAAMFMHIAVNVIKAGFHVSEDPADAVASVNTYLCGHNEAEMFVTAWFGVLDPKTGEVEYVNAGHNRPYVVRKDGRAERIDVRGGRILGMYPGKAYRSSRLRLEPGDRLFLYTDGVTEAMDRSGCLYGNARLETLLGTRPDDLCTAVKESVDEFARGAESSDDLTMLSLAWHGVPPCVRRSFPLAAIGEAVAFVRSESRLKNGKQLTRLLNAADEVISNVVNYSGVGEFAVTVENVPGRCRVTVRDAGTAYNPLLHADPDTHVPLQERPLGGLGILMTKKLVTSVTYRREDGMNVLSLVQADRVGKYRQIS